MPHLLPFALPVLKLSWGRFHSSCWVATSRLRVCVLNPLRTVLLDSQVPDPFPIWMDWQKEVAPFVLYPSAETQKTESQCPRCEKSSSHISLWSNMVDNDHEPCDSHPLILAAMLSSCLASGGVLSSTCGCVSLPARGPGDLLFLRLSWDCEAGPDGLLGLLEVIPSHL